MTCRNGNNVLVNGSLLVTEAMVQAGAEVYVGYPITPANLLYAYGRKRFPIFLPAPDEITALQWVSGFAATGKVAVTATSFPGFALMIETLNMAYMMELPLVIVLVQRLGPSTGSATAGAQGDLLLLRSCISGGHPLPVLCPSDNKDCWHLAAESISLSHKLRTPVILLTSKEMMMTSASFDISRLPDITALEKKYYNSDKPYKPYLAGDDLVPPLLPLGNEKHQVRLNASTHETDGLIKKATKEALANTRRLNEKVRKRISEYTYFSLDEQEGSETLIVSYGISSAAARDAVNFIRKNGQKISLLIVKTLFPVSAEIFNLLDKYSNILIVEENLDGSYKEIIYGQRPPGKIKSVNKIGQMISPSEIVREVRSWQ